MWTFAAAHPVWFLVYLLIVCVTVFMSSMAFSMGWSSRAAKATPKDAGVLN